MILSKKKGRLIAIGGGELRDGPNEEIFGRFMQYAGASHARIVVMAVALDKQSQTPEIYAETFRELGAEEVATVIISDREETHMLEALNALEQATGIFFTGGDQLHVTALLGGTVMDRTIHRVFAEGVIIGGTSAGAAMMSDAIIIGGESKGNPRLGSIEMGHGMEFILGAVIDTHFSERGRHGRLLTAVAQYPHALGIGIDENTAVVIEGDELEVLGENAVTIFDAGRSSYTNLPLLRRFENLSLYDIALHILPRGHRYSMKVRSPIKPPEAVAEMKAPTVRTKRSRVRSPRASRRSTG